MPSAQAGVKRGGGARRTSVSQSWKVGAWVDHFDARFVPGADAPLLDGRYIVDLEASIPLTPDVTLAVGGQNVFDGCVATVAGGGW